MNYKIIDGEKVYGYRWIIRLFAISIDSIYARIVNRIDYSVTC